MVFNDAARLYIGECEGLGEILDAASFDNFFFVGFAVKVDDRAVGPDGAGPNAMNVPLALDQRDFHVGVLTAFFSEYFFPHIIVFMGRSNRTVVPVNLTVEDDCRSARRLWLAGHFELFRRDGLPFVAGTYRWARRTAAPTKSKSASTNRRREVKIGLPFETGRYAEFERTRSVHLGELTARRSSVALTRFAVGREVRWSRPMNIVADLSNVYRWTLQGCYPPVNRAGTSWDGKPLPVPRRGFSSPPRSAAA